MFVITYCKTNLIHFFLSNTSITFIFKKALKFLTKLFVLKMSMIKLLFQNAEISISKTMKSVSTQTDHPHLSKN